MSKTTPYLLMLLVGGLFIGSCTSYNKVKPLKSTALIESYAVDSFEVKDFDVYTFNICQYYAKDIDGSKRFIQCPERFFEVSEKEELKKVEELYFLKHSKSPLVLYLTTFSRRYTGPQKGFLNDSTIYKNKFYLEDIEYVYVGNVTSTNDSIVFENQTDNSKMIWHTNQAMLKDIDFAIEAVNIETVENVGEFDKKIVLNKVFSVPFDLKKSKLKLYDITPGDPPKLLETLYILNRSNQKKEVLFQRRDSVGFRFPTSKVLYFPSD